MLKGFLFDLDGTLWDSEKTIKTILQSSVESKAKIIENDILDELKNSISPMEILKKYEIPKESYWNLYRKNYAEIKLFFTDTPEVLETLLRRGKSVGFITSLKKEFVMSLLEKFGLLKYAQVLITPSECRTAKPSPTPVIMALNKLSIENVQAIYIGDQNSDILAAKRAGCKSGLAKWGNRTVNETPDYVFEKLDDILLLREEG